MSLSRFSQVVSINENRQSVNVAFARQIVDIVANAHEFGHSCVVTMFISQFGVPVPHTAVTLTSAVRYVGSQKLKGILVGLKGVVNVITFLSGGSVETHYFYGEPVKDCPGVLAGGVRVVCDSISLQELFSLGEGGDNSWMQPTVCGGKEKCPKVCVGAVLSVRRVLCRVCGFVVLAEGHSDRCRKQGVCSSTNDADWYGDALHTLDVTTALVFRGEGTSTRTMTRARYCSAVGQANWLSDNGIEVGVSDGEKSRYFEQHYLSIRARYLADQFPDVPGKHFVVVSDAGPDVKPDPEKSIAVNADDSPLDLESDLHGRVVGGGCDVGAETRVSCESQRPSGDGPHKAGYDVAKLNALEGPQDAMALIPEMNCKSDVEAVRSRLRNDRVDGVDDATYTLVMSTLSRMFKQLPGIKEKCDSGLCYRRAFVGSAPDLGKWPLACDVVAVAGCDGDVMCRSSGDLKHWHVLEKGSKVIPGDRPLRRLPTDARVGGLGVMMIATRTVTPFMMGYVGFAVAQSTLLWAFGRERFDSCGFLELRLFWLAVFRAVLTMIKNPDGRLMKVRQRLAMLLIFCGAKLNAGR